MGRYGLSNRTGMLFDSGVVGLSSIQQHDGDILRCDGLHQIDNTFIEEISAISLKVQLPETFPVHCRLRAVLLVAVDVESLQGLVLVLHSYV